MASFLPRQDASRTLSLAVGCRVGQVAADSAEQRIRRGREPRRSCQTGRGGDERERRGRRGRKRGQRRRRGQERSGAPLLLLLPLVLLARCLRSAVVVLTFCQQGGDGDGKAMGSAVTASDPRNVSFFLASESRTSHLSPAAEWLLWFQRH